MTSDSAKRDQPCAVEMVDSFLPAERRDAEGQRPAIGLEAARGARDAAVEVGDVGRVERIDRVEPLRRMARGQPDRPGAVILDGRGRPGAEARRLEAAHRREIEPVRAGALQPSA